MSGLERIGWLLLAVAVVGGSVLEVSVATDLQPAELFRRVQAAWFGLPLVALVLAVCGVMALPAAPVMLLSGSLWGWRAAPWVAVGMGLGAGIGYAVGRLGAGAAILDRGRRLQVLASRYGVLVALFSRFLPGVPFAVQNLSCGALRIGVVPYLLGTAGGVGVTAAVLIAVGQVGGEWAMNTVHVMRGAWAVQGLLAVAGTVMVVVARRRRRCAVGADGLQG